MNTIQIIESSRCWKHTPWWNTQWFTAKTLFILLYRLFYLSYKATYSNSVQYCTINLIQLKFKRQSLIKINFIFCLKTLIYYTNTLINYMNTLICYMNTACINIQLNNLPNLNKFQLILPSVTSWLVLKTHSLMKYTLFYCTLLPCIYIQVSIATLNKLNLV